MTYNGKQTTYAGTFVKSQVITPTPNAEWKVSRVLITTNEQPYKKPDKNYMGWFSSADEVLEYFTKTSKTYKLVKHFFQQQGRNNPKLNDAYVLIYYVDIVDATCATMTTENLASRLSNFAPTGDDYYFKGKLNITSGNGSNKTIEIKLTKQPTMQQLATALNQTDCEAYFEVVDVDYEDQESGETLTRQELKVSSLFAGSQSQLVIEAVTEQNVNDLGSANFLNLISTTATAGADATNNETSYFSDILKELTKDYGFNPRTLLTTCILDYAKLKAINDELASLYQDEDENKCCQFITSLSGKDENDAFNGNFATQPLYLTCINAGYTKEASLYVAGAICAGFVSVDILENERNNPEWSNIILDEDVYTNQKGLSNKEANDIVKDGYVCALQFMSEGTGLVVRGSEKGWDIAMHSCYIQIVNKIPVEIGNLMKNVKNKSKSLPVKSLVLLTLKSFGKTIFNNNFLSNNPRVDDTVFTSLTEERQREIQDIGWSPYIKPLNQIKGNKIPYEIAICLSGIMASFNGIYEITNN